MSVCLSVCLFLCLSLCVSLYLYLSLSSCCGLAEMKRIDYKRALGNFLGDGNELYLSCGGGCTMYMNVQFHGTEHQERGSFIVCT